MYGRVGIHITTESYILFSSQMIEEYWNLRDQFALEVSTLRPKQEFRACVKFLATKTD